MRLVLVTNQVARDLESYLETCQHFKRQRPELPVEFARALQAALRRQQRSSEHVRCRHGGETVQSSATGGDESSTSSISSSCTATALSSVHVKVRGLAKTHSGAILLRSQQVLGKIRASQGPNGGWIPLGSVTTNSQTSSPKGQLVRAQNSGSGNGISCAPSDDTLTLPDAVERCSRLRPKGRKAADSVLLKPLWNIQRSVLSISSS